MTNAHPQHSKNCVTKTDLPLQSKKILHPPKTTNPLQSLGETYNGVLLPHQGWCCCFAHIHLIPHSKRGHSTDWHEAAHKHTPTSSPQTCCLLSVHLLLILQWPVLHGAGWSHATSTQAFPTHLSPFLFAVDSLSQIYEQYSNIECTCPL